MKFKEWWKTTRFYKWLQTFQYEVVLLEEKKDLVLTFLKEEIKELKDESKEAESWFEKITEEEKAKWKERGVEVYDNLTNRTMEVEAQGQSLPTTDVGAINQGGVNQAASPIDDSSMKLGENTEPVKDIPEPTELEKIVSSLKTHLDNLTSLAGISDVAKKLNPTGFSALATTVISDGIADGTGIIDTIKKYVTDAETLVENISILHGFIKKQV